MRVSLNLTSTTINLTLTLSHKTDMMMAFAYGAVHDRGNLHAPLALAFSVGRVCGGVALHMPPAAPFVVCS